MTPGQVLHERARRQGLEQREGGCWWSGNTQVVWGSDREGWVWCPPWERISHSSVPYSKQEPALRAALDWLDEQRPERAWAPSPGAKLAEVVGLLREAQQASRYTGHPSTGVVSDFVSQALALLGSLALPSASDESAVLAVAWDYALHRGGLSAEAQRALVAAVRHHPEVVGEARLLGPWIPHGSIKDDPEPWAFYRFPAFGLEKVLEVRSEYPISNPGEEWVVVIDDERLPEVYETPEEAREAADRTARDQGWWPMAGIQEPFGGEEEPEEPLERNQFPEEPTATIPCSVCLGDGRVRGTFGALDTWEACGHCAGTGRRA